MQHSSYSETISFGWPTSVVLQFWVRSPQSCSFWRESLPREHLYANYYYYRQYCLWHVSLFINMSRKTNQDLGTLTLHETLFFFIQSDCEMTIDGAVMYYIWMAFACLSIKPTVISRSQTNSWIEVLINKLYANICHICLSISVTTWNWLSVYTISSV